MQQPHPIERIRQLGLISARDLALAHAWVALRRDTSLPGASAVLAECCRRLAGAAVGVFEPIALGALPSALHKRISGPCSLDVYARSEAELTILRAGLDRIADLLANLFPNLRTAANDNCLPAASAPAASEA